MTLPSSTAARSPAPAGTVLAGKYRIERILGEGGMGVVVAALHLQLDQRVAIKFLLPDALEDADVVARFAREARAAAKIQSEHVARVIDVGTLETGSPYIVMEYLEGRDLGAELEARGVLPIEETVGYVLEACEAIAEAHSVGIVHRDLKPANLFLAQRPDRRIVVKVLDFGISKSQTLSATDAKLTATRAIMGSPLYMSPEQMRASRDADARSDIWSLGCILYEALTGRTPYIAESMTEIIARVLTTDHASARSLRADVPFELDAVLARCLAKDPKGRYEDVGALAADLLAFGPPRAEASVERITRVLGRSGAPERLGSGPDLGRGVHTRATLAATEKSFSQSGDHEPTAPRPARGARLAIFGGVVAVALTAGVAAFVLRPGGRVLSTATAVASAQPERVTSAPGAQAPPVAAAPSVAAVPSASAPVAAAAAVETPPTPSAAAVAPEKPAESAAKTGAAGRPSRRGQKGNDVVPPTAPAPTPAPAPVPRRNPLQIDLK